jgi:hypothetical protein
MEKGIITVLWPGRGTAPRTHGTRAEHVLLLSPQLYHYTAHTRFMMYHPSMAALNVFYTMVFENTPPHSDSCAALQDHIKPASLKA